MVSAENSDWMNVDLEASDRGIQWKQLTRFYEGTTVLIDSHRIDDQPGYVRNEYDDSSSESQKLGLV